MLFWKSIWLSFECNSRWEKASFSTVICWSLAVKNMFLTSHLDSFWFQLPVLDLACIFVPEYSSLYHYLFYPYEGTCCDQLSCLCSLVQTEELELLNLLPWGIYTLHKTVQWLCSLPSSFPVPLPPPTPASPRTRCIIPVLVSVTIQG